MSIYKTNIQLEYIGNKIAFRLVSDASDIEYLTTKYPDAEFVPVHNSTFTNVTEITEVLTEYYIILNERDAMIFKISE